MDESCPTNWQGDGTVPNSFRSAHSHIVQWCVQYNRKNKNGINLFMTCFCPLAALANAAHALDVARIHHTRSIGCTVERIVQSCQQILALRISSHCFSIARLHAPSRDMGACVSSEGCAGGESACTLKEEGYMDNEGEDMKVYINAKVRRTMPQ